MKKIIFAAILTAISVCGMEAQSIYDMQGLTTPNINGTARYMSMAGSFGALGGDVSAILDNPATLGIFRKSEINFSLKIVPTYTSGFWNGEKNSDNRTKFGLNNITWVLNLPTRNETGYLASNLSFGYHKIKDFNRRIGLSNRNMAYSLTDVIASMTNDLYEDDLIEANDPYNNPDVGFLSELGYQGYLIDPVTAGGNQWKTAIDGQLGGKYMALERGSIDDFNFTYSGNISDVFYFGLGTSMQSYNRTLESKYSENFYNINNDYFDLYNYTYQSGVGINFKFGGIFRVAPAFRLGISFQTPTYYSFKTQQKADLYTNVVDGKTSTPYNTWNYGYRSPLKAQISAGVVIGKRAALNVDYQISTTKTMKFTSPYDDAFWKVFQIENDDVKEFAKSIVHTIKFGAEVIISKNIKLRGGVAYITSPLKNNFQKNFAINTTRTDLEYFADKSQIFGTGGIGFNFGKIALDFAYVFNGVNQTFMPFKTDREVAGEVHTFNHNVVATFSFKY